MNSGKTAIRRGGKLSAPVKFLKGYLEEDKRILDFGCGYGEDVAILKQQGFNIEGYDSTHRKQKPTQKFDTILCIYVLNTLTHSCRLDVLRQISELLEDDGEIWFAFRSDKVEGRPFEDGVLTSINTFQKSFTEEDVADLLRPNFFVTDLEKVGHFIIARCMN